MLVVLCNIILKEFATHAKIVLIGGYVCFVFRGTNAEEEADTSKKWSTS